MSQTSLKVLIVADNPQLCEESSNALKQQGVNCVAIAVADTTSDDAEVTKVAKSETWDGYIVGKGIQKNQAWFDRVKTLVQSGSPGTIFVDPASRDDVNNALEQKFNIKLPIQKA